MAALLGLAVAGVVPQHALNITLYHFNQHKFGAIPLDMDTGDLVGDLIFDLWQVLMVPLTCFNGSATKPSPFSPFDPCANPEMVGDSLMVNKVTLEVDRRFSSYGMCNVGLNGSHPDPLSNHTCATGTYCCVCFNETEVVPCEDTLGYQNLFETWIPRLHPEGGCKASAWKPHPTTSDCYRTNLWRKLGKADHGAWYSSLAQGYCGTPGSACTWRVVSVDKIVRRDCHAKVFGEAVQATGDPACLDACGAQRSNISSPCWVDCFYQAALGPDAGKVGGDLAGLSLDELKAAWSKPFADESKGGCPAQPEVRVHTPDV